MASLLLAVVALTAAGIGAGVLTSVAISVFPALSTMPPDRYVETHRLVGKGYHPTMPIVFNVGMVAALGLGVLEWGGPSALPAFAGAAAMLASQCVSHLGNVPINRRLAVLDPGDIPEDWDDPRPRWRTLNWVRACLSVSALVLLAGAAAVL